MEPETSLKHPEDLVLRKPAKWYGNTLSFLELAGDSQLQTLEGHAFLKAAHDSVYIHERRTYYGKEDLCVLYDVPKRD